MKIINLKGMTIAERLKYLEEITQEIYNHLYDDFRWVFSGAYVDNETSYSMVSLEGFKDIGDEVKTGQVVYFAQSGVLAVINQINNPANTFTVKNNYVIKGPKGDTGEQGEQGEKGQIGNTGLTALECLSTTVQAQPIERNTAELSQGLFNRTPVIGDRFILFCKYSTNSYICGCAVQSISGGNVTFMYIKVTNIIDGLPDSAKSQLYEHNVFLNITTTSSENSPLVFIYQFTYISTSPQPISTNDLNEFYSKYMSQRSGSTYGFGLSVFNNALIKGLYYIRASWITSNTVQFIYLNYNNSLYHITSASLNLQTILDSNSEYKFICTDTVFSIGSEQTNLVLYADKNGVLLDNKNLSEQFTKMVAAGSNESKILESINKARFLK